MKANLNNKIIFKPKRNWIKAKKTAENDIILNKDSSIKINSISKQKGFLKIDKPGNSMLKK